ncbi:MAG: hypothetical protein ABFD94_16920, partial [Armatimonadia bacterium]
LFYEWTSKRFIMPRPTNFAVMQAQANWAYIADTSGYNAQLAQIIAQNQATWASGALLGGALGATTLNTYSVNGSLLLDQPAQADTRNVQAIVIADDTQITSSGFTDDNPVRMPASRKAYSYEVRLTGNAPLRTFRMATSIGELREV